MRPRPIFHPFLFAWAPALFLYSRNFQEIEASELPLPLALLALLAGVLFLAGRLILKDRAFAAATVSLLLLLFFSYGRFHELAQEWTVAGIRVGGHRFLLPLWAAVFAALFLAGRRFRGRLSSWTAVFTVVGLVLVGLPLLGIARQAIRAERAGPAVALPPVPLRPPEGGGGLPNVYYVILDAYARGDILREVYGFDNSEFLDALKSRGFYVAERARSNYDLSLISLASSLNWSYLDEKRFRASKIGYPRSLLLNNRTAASLRGLGYRFAAFSSGYDKTELRAADLYFSCGWSPSEFQNELINATPLPPLLALLGGESAQYRRHRQRILFALEEIPETALLPGPLFVFAHLGAPHPPFVFGENGEPVQLADYFLSGDAAGFLDRLGISREEYRERYVRQLKFMNRKVLEMVDGLLRRSSRPPIIILQADHGPRSEYVFCEFEKSNVREGLSILNAYHLPDGGEKALYPGITPANTFRAIFNHYFGAGLEMLADRSYFTDWRDGYFAFREVPPEARLVPRAGAVLPGPARRPGEADWMIQSAYACYEVDDFQTASELFSRVLAADPENPSALLGLGYSEEGMEHFQEAERYFERFLSLGAPGAADLVHLSRFFRERGNLDRAAGLAAEARRREPDGLEAILEEGEIYLARGDVTRAAGSFRAAVDLDPSDVRAYIGWKHCSENGAPVRPPSPAPPVPVAGSSPPAGFPDIVLLSIDALRPDRLSCYGNPSPTSPALDELAREGVLFRRVLSQCPTSAPSYMSLLTALMPDVNLVRNLGVGVRQRANSLPAKIATYAELLRANGYFTAAVHGGAELDGSLGFARGFDLFRDSFDHLRLVPGALPADIAAAIGESRARGKPLFLFIHHNYCHDPYVFGPPEIRRRFLRRPVPGLPTGLEGLGKNGADIVKSFWKGIDLSRPDHRDHALQLYDGGVAVADDLFRRLRELLAKEGIYDKALIAVLADQGQEFYEHQSRCHGRLFIEHLRVPLIVKFPGGLFAGREIAETVRLIDLIPTICDWAGLPALPRRQGVSFLPLLAGRGSYRPTLVSYSIDLSRIRLEEGGFSYCWEWDPRHVRLQEHLFDLAADPDEAADLVSARPEAADRLRKRAREIRGEKKMYLDWIISDVPRAAAAPSPTPVSLHLLKQLKALGYDK